MDDNEKIKAPKNLIEMNSSWAIGSDSMSVTLYKKTKNQKTGKEAWAIEGHFPDFSWAARAMVDRSVQTCKSFDLMIHKLNALKQDITALSSTWRV